MALVVPNPNSAEPPTKQALYDLLANSFEKWQMPDAIEFVAEIPKTSTGKFNKRIIREQYKAYVLPSQA